MNADKSLGGRPTLEQEAESKHEKAEIKIDLEMSKLSLKVIKHLAKMVNKIDTYKENIQLGLVDRVLKENKDYMKAKRELEGAKKQPSTKECVVDTPTYEKDLEDALPTLDLSAPTTPKTIN